MAETASPRDRSHRRTPRHALTAASMPQARGPKTRRIPRQIPDRGPRKGGEPWGISPHPPPHPRIGFSPSPSVGDDAKSRVGSFPTCFEYVFRVGSASAGMPRRGGASAAGGRSSSGADREKSRVARASTGASWPPGRCVSPDDPRADDAHTMPALAGGGFEACSGSERQRRRPRAAARRRRAPTLLFPGVVATRGTSP